MGINRFEQLCPRGSRGVSMSQTYHPNFKSFDRYVKEVEVMHYIIRDRLEDLDDIQRQTTPWEIDAWNADELKSFEIDFKSIDRLYYIDILAPWGGRRFHMIGRKDCDGQLIYFHLQSVSKCDCENERDCMNVSKDVRLFMRYVNLWTPFNSNNEIDEVLMEDGINVEVYPHFDIERCVHVMEVESLEEICQEVIFKHKNELEPTFDKLPKRMTTRIEKFIYFKNNSLIWPKPY